MAVICENAEICPLQFFLFLVVVAVHLSFVVLRWNSIRCRVFKLRFFAPAYFPYQSSIRGLVSVEATYF